jgi:4-aminobutyrate aminotransferase
VLGLEGDFAEFIAEPIRWTTIFPPPPDFWSRVRESCDRHGTLLIFDEIPSALARTGRMFACEHFDAVPDILVIGKGLGGGIMPMAAMIARADLDLAGDGALGHYTHEKSPVGCAAALATIDVIVEEGLCARAEALGRHGMERLNHMVAKSSMLTEATGIGLMLGVKAAGENPDQANAHAEAILYASLERGLSFKIGGGSTLTLCPPLTISENQFDRALDILEASLAAASAM